MNIGSSRQGSPRCPWTGRTRQRGDLFRGAGDNKIRRIELDGNIGVLADADHANSLTVGPEGQLYAVSSKTGKIMRYDTLGNGSLVVEGFAGNIYLPLRAAACMSPAMAKNPANREAFGSSRTAKKHWSILV